jgi:hypothetical protein
MPWAFAARARTDFPVSFTVSSVGMGATAAGVVLTNVFGGLVGTTVLPAEGVFRLINPGQITVETTPLWEEVGEIRLFAPGLLPRTLHVQETGDLPSTGTDPRAAEALTAIAEIGRWLNRSPKDVAELCRFSLRAARYWGSGKTARPRPSTVRHLYEVHSFVGSLVRSIGMQSAREWLALPTETGDRRLDVLATEQGIKGLLREAGDVLFSQAPARERPVPESLVTAEDDLDAEPYAPSSNTAPPRRARRAPRRAE